MREQYPFFRDGDEKTQAIIGEEAVNADLDGAYQKPYAILTQKRLYCKNEQGNFITDASALQSANKGLLPGKNWFLWAVAACVGLALVLLCLWYWGMGGLWQTKDIGYSAQKYIENYHALKEKIPEYQQTVKDYEDTEKEIEQLQQKLEEIDHDKIMQEASQVFQKADRLQAALDEAEAARDEQQNLVTSFENEIAEYNRYITEAEEQIKNTDTVKNNEIKSQIDALDNTLSNWRRWKNAKDADFSLYRVSKTEGETYPPTVYQFNGQEFQNTNQIRTYCDEKMKEIQTDLSDLWEKYINIEDLEYNIDLNRQCIAESESYLVDYRKQLEEAQKVVDTAMTEVTNYQPTVEAIREKVNEVESLRADQAKKQSALDSAALADAQSNIQRFEDSKLNYKNAQSVQRKVKLFPLCFLVFAVCVVVFIILTALKRTKPAVIAALASACVGLVCASLSNINQGNFSDFGWGYYIMPHLVSIVLRVLSILAIILGVLALWWNRKKMVYQIVHNTGAFYFTPSVYPAEELKLFTEQVQLMRGGEADGK